MKRAGRRFERTPGSVLRGTDFAPGDTAERFAVSRTATYRRFHGPLMALQIEGGARLTRATDAATSKLVREWRRAGPRPGEPGSHATCRVTARAGKDDGDCPESLAEFQRRGPVARPVVFRQGPGDRDGGPARRGRRPGARDREIPGAAPAAGLEAAGLVLVARISAPRGIRASTSGRRCCWPISRGLLQSPPVFPLSWSRRARVGRRPGCPMTATRSGLERQPPYPLGSDLGVVGLGSPRPAGGGPGAGGAGRMPRQRPKDRGVGAIRWAARRGAGASAIAGASRLETGVPRPSRPAQDQGIVGPGMGSGAGAARTKAVNRNAKRLLVYVLDVAATLAQNQVVIDLARRQRKTTGEWGPLRPWYYAPQRRPRQVRPRGSPDPGPARRGPRRLGPCRPFRPAARVAPPASASGRAGRKRPTAAGAVQAFGSAAARAAAERALRGTRRFVLRKDQAALVERLARTGRLRLRRTEGEEDPPTMRWDDGQPWRFSLDIRAESGGKRWAWRGSLRRGDAPDGPLRAPGSPPGPVDPGRRPRRPVRRPGRHALDRPAPLREGDHLRRASARPDAGPDPGRDPRAADSSWSSRCTSRRSTPSPGPA